MKIFICLTLLIFSFVVQAVPPGAIDDMTGVGPVRALASDDSELDEIEDAPVLLEEERSKFGPASVDEVNHDEPDYENVVE